MMKKPLEKPVNEQTPQPIPENYEADAILTVNDNAGNNFRANVKVNVEGEIHFEYDDPHTGEKKHCDINKANPEGVGNPDACQILQTQVRNAMSKQNLRDRY